MQPGDRIGAYTIVSLIGAGGMSIVYLADDTTNNVQVALKELRQQYLAERQLVDRFIRAAEVLKDLRHPHLARVLDRFERDGRYFTVEEYLPGGSLADLLTRSDVPSEFEALTWCRDVLSALNYVHEFGIVHRDLKTSNLMLDANRNVRVIDFGIARVFGEARITRTGDAAIGTACYMSPEQIRTPGAVDHLTDVYSAGVVLYELLTGSVPFDGDSQFAIFDKITRHAPPAMRTLKPGIDPALEKIVFRAMEKDPKRRYGGCGEFALRIDRYLKRRWPPDVKEPSPGLIERIGSSIPVLSAGRVAIGFLAVIVLLLIGLVTMNMHPLVGRTATVDAPGIRLMSSVEPAAVSQAGTVVAFGYQVTNIGNIPLKSVKVVDGGETPPVFVSGDTNGDGALDGDETWRFESKITIEQAQLESGSLVRHAVATSDRVTSDPIDIDVKFGRHPAMAISTLVNGAKSAQLKAPGPVTYTYSVSNIGNVALTNVRVLDQHGATPVLRGGDSNGNSVLDVGETWEYQATLTVTAPAMDPGNALVSRAVAVSDQSRSDSDEVKLTFAARGPVVPVAPVAPVVPVVPVVPVRVGGPIAPPHKAKDVRPVYPPDVQAAGIQGEVNLEITIGANGRVQDARVVGSTTTPSTGTATPAARALLEEAAIAAARQWEYSPTLRNGVAVPVINTVNVRFVLTPPATDATARPGQEPVTAVPPVGGGGATTAPQRTKDAVPVYPPEALSAGVQGTVMIEATIAPSGRVQATRILRSIPMLDQAALDAVRQWEYAPTLVNGVAVPITVTVGVQFSLTLK